MTLADIKFNYQEKIDKVNIRINKYNEIIEKYTIKIKEAEKEENPNISSVIKAKKQYEHKIENMKTVKSYYQEFVDTSDYLLQNLNNEEQFLLIAKNNQLEKENEDLLIKIKNLERLLEDEQEISKNKGILFDLEKIKVKQLREKHSAKMDNLRITHSEKEKHQREKINSLKKYKHQVKKLTEENKMLNDTNEFLEKRIKRLEDYCNDLLSRKTNESFSIPKSSEGNLIFIEDGKVIGVKSEKNILKEAKL